MNTQSAPVAVVSCTQCGQPLARGLICACCRSLLFRQFAQGDSDFRRDQGIKRFPEYDRLRT